MSTMSSKEKIINASMMLFVENGYKKTTTKMIAKEAGVNEVTVFRLFGTKEAIVQEIVRMRLPYIRAIQAYFQTQAVHNLQDDLMKVAAMYYEIISNNIDMLMILSHEMGPAFQEMFSVLPLGLKATLVDYFMKMQKDGKVIDTDPELLTISFITPIMGFTTMNKLSNNSVTALTYQEIIENSIRVFVKGVTP